MIVCLRVGNAAGPPGGRRSQCYTVKGGQGPLGCHFPDVGCIIGVIPDQGRVQRGRRVALCNP
jgi:hypothetical protein